MYLVDEIKKLSYITNGQKRYHGQVEEVQCKDIILDTANFMRRDPT